MKDIEHLNEEIYSLQTWWYVMIRADPFFDWLLKPWPSHTKDFNKLGGPLVLWTKFSLVFTALGIFASQQKQCFPA